MKRALPIMVTALATLPLCVAFSAVAPAASPVAGLNLDICQPDKDGKKLASKCEGLAAASAVVAPTSSFSLGDASQIPELAPFVGKNYVPRILTGVWNGIIFITKDGEHNFQVNLRTTDYIESMSAGCRATLNINDVQVAKAAGATGYNKGPYPAQGALTLEKGFYKFELALSCSARGDEFDKVTVDLSMAEPGERRFKPISPDRFGVEQ